MSPDRGVGNDFGPGSGDRRERWAAYLAATVVVHLEGRTLDLTGPDAVIEWPFDGAVLALTAWDPAGRARERAENDLANEQLRAALISAGVVVHDSSGYMATPNGGVRGIVPGNATGAFVDHGFVVEDVDEERILDIAGEFGQEAIYRIDALELIVIPVDGSNERVGRGRLDHRG